MILAKSVGNCRSESIRSQLALIIGMSFFAVSNIGSGTFEFVWSDAEVIG